MSTTYSVKAGDTFESIARRVYGNEQEAALIKSANPGVLEPLTAGVQIVTPPSPNALQGEQQEQPADNVDEVALKISGTRFRFWQSLAITRSLDAMDQCSLAAPMESDEQEFRERFRPFSYQPVDVSVGGEPLFTGTMMTPSPRITPDTMSISVSCYSLPAVLGDCTPPASSFPLEYNNQGLQEISASLAAPFGLSVSMDASQGAVFERVACDADRTVLEFLAELAKQRNLIIGSTERGALSFRRPDSSGQVAATLTQGESPLMAVSPSFDTQTYFSDITGLSSVEVGLKGSKFTAKNERLVGIVRPHTFKAPDTKDADMPAAVNAKLSRMLGAMVSYSATVATWRTKSGELWKPGDIIALTAPGAMVYTQYKLMVRSVTFRAQADSRTADLTLVMPESYSGGLPESLPWD